MLLIHGDRLELTYVISILRWLLILPPGPMEKPLSKKSPTLGEEYALLSTKELNSLTLKMPPRHERGGILLYLSWSESLSYGEKPKITVGHTYLSYSS